MKTTTKLISILLVMAMLLSMAPLSLNAFASANDKLFIYSSYIKTNGYAVTIEAGSKSGYSKVKVDGEYVDFSACKYSSGEPMFTLGDSNYEADLSNTNIYGPDESMTGDLHITMTGGVVKYLAGGCSGSGSVLTGNVYITMTGGKVTEIWGTEYSVNGDINVTMTGGTVTSYINLLYRSSITVNGDVNVSITGGSPGTIAVHSSYYQKLNGSANIYATVAPYGYLEDIFHNYVYLSGTTWKFGGNTAAALNGNTLTIASGQTATVDSGKTLSGTIVNNGTINVKSGGTLSGTITNKGTIWGYGNISGTTNSGSGKIIKKVTASGTNVTFNDSAWQNNAANYDDAYTATLTAASGYALPASVTVNVGGTVLAASNYTYNSSTGVLSIPAAKITADTTVSASALIDLSDSANEVTLERNQFTYNGEPISVIPRVNGSSLNENDYTAEYSNNLNVGTGTVTITGKNSYTGSATLEYTIYPASMLGANITLADSLVYNGSEQTMKVESVVFDGKTLKEDVDYVVRDNTGTDAGVYVLEITGINNVQDSITMEWEIKARPVTVTADDMSKIYGEEDPQNFGYSYDLSYPQYMLNGEPSRVQGENVGVYEIGQGTLTNENNPNYNITFNKGYFTIEPDTSGIDALDVDNVKSTDKAAVEAVKAQLDNAVTDLAGADKKNEWSAILAKCNDLLAKIADTSEKYNKCVEDAAKYNVETVTSADKAALEAILAAANEMLGTDNYTLEERAVLIQITADIQTMLSRISSVGTEIARIESAINAYNIDSVKSSDRADIVQLIADIKALTDGTNITDEERAKLENLDAAADELIKRIDETAAEFKRVNDAAGSYDAATVTSDDKDALIQLDSDIFALALTNNVTADEKTTLMNSHTIVFACIQRITYVSNEIKRIVEAVEKYVFESVKSDDKADIEQLIEDIKALTDTQNLTADERAILENADETCDKLIAKIDETVAEINRINDATNAYDVDTITSADKADIEKLIGDIKALTDGDNITDAEREQLNGNDEALDALLKKINEVADEIARIEEAVNAYDEDSVKSTDKTDLEQLIEDIKALTNGQNITDEERAKLAELDEKIDALIKKIDDTAAEAQRIEKAVDGYDEATVKSSDKEDIEQLKEDAQALLDGDNLTEKEADAIEEKLAQAEDLAEKIAETEAEIERIEEAVDGYDIDTVKMTDKAEIEQLKKDIEALKETGNVTDEEIDALEEKLAEVEALIERIEETEAQLEEIAGIENGYDVATVTSDDKAKIEETIAEIDAVNPDNLTDEQKAEYEEIKKELEALLNHIAKAGNKVEAAKLRLDMFLEERVTIFWEDDINAFIAEIDALLADENMGEAEKATLNEYKAQAEHLIEVIRTPAEYLSARFFYFIWDCLNWKLGGISAFFNSIFAALK